MIISELSRFSQLDERCQIIARNTMNEYGVTHDALYTEIITQVSTVNAVTLAETSAWYDRANKLSQEIASTYCTSPTIVAGVISAVSPRMPWLRNLHVAEKIVEIAPELKNSMTAMQAAKKIGLALSSNVAMAVSITWGEDISETLTGVKRRSFYNNIVSPKGNDSVTIDTWMLNALCKVTNMTKKDAQNFAVANRATGGFNGTGVGYIAVADAVRDVAKTLMMRPSAVQAAYWCAASGSMNGGRTGIEA